MTVDLNEKERGRRWGIMRNRIIWKDVRSFEMNFKKDVQISWKKSILPSS